MVEQRNDMAQDRNERCAELRDALAAHQSMLMERINEEQATGSSIEAPMAVPSPQNDPTTGFEDRTAVEQEITRIEEQLRANGCN